jgi:hypothetical protein
MKNSDRQEVLHEAGSVAFGIALSWSIGGDDNYVSRNNQMNNRFRIPVTILMQANQIMHSSLYGFCMWHLVPSEIEIQFVTKGAL